MVKLNWLEKKNDDWLKAEVINEAGATIRDVSINRVGKKGEVFPDFDNLKAGHQINGILWQSPKGGWYLFPPKEKKNNSRGAYMEKVMEKKDQSISKFQGAKEENIKLASTIRMAVDCAIAEYGGAEVSTEKLQRAVQGWRKWLWQEWERPVKGETLSYLPESDPLEENTDLTKKDQAADEYFNQM